MSPFFSFLLLLPFLFVNPAHSHSRSRHVINFPSSSNLRPSSLAWDPSLQHFIVGSSHLPLISAISDAGVIQTLVSTSSSSSSSHVTAIAVDDSHRRLVAAFSSPATISSFDLRSAPPLRLLFSSPINHSASGVAVDPVTGTAFVTSSDRILAVDLQGDVSLLSQVSGADLGGLAHVSRGFLLVVDKSDGGEILKVDDEDGTVRSTEILTATAVLEEAEVVAMRRDGAAVVGGGAKARWVTSKDGWSECAVFDEFEVKEEEGESVVGVAVRENKNFYVLVRRKEEVSRIEEAEWGRESEGEMVWLLALVGFGMAYFMYWRLQMGKLVRSVNKKRE